jgi:hypothetical protein
VKTSSITSFTGPLTAAQFHAIGTAVDAAPLLPGQTGAAALNMTSAAVSVFEDEICNFVDGLYILIRPSASPKSVPAYEAILAEVPRRCPKVTEHALASCDS